MSDLFDRVPPAYRPALERARELLRVGTTARVLAGVDPIFAGLHDAVDAQDSRSYRNTAHVVWPCHLARRSREDRRSTVVLPTLAEPERLDATCVHELAHVLDHDLGFSIDVPPVTDYARRNRYEAFAEAVTTLVFTAGPTTPEWLSLGYAAAQERVRHDEAFAELRRIVTPA